MRLEVFFSTFSFCRVAAVRQTATDVAFYRTVIAIDFELVPTHFYLVEIVFEKKMKKTHVPCVRAVFVNRATAFSI